MIEYAEINPDFAHRLINHGPVVMVSTRDAQGNYNIAPIAWISPAQKNPPRVMISFGHGRHTYKNILESKEFAVCLPHVSQVRLLRLTGRSSGAETNKFAEFEIKAFPAAHLDLLIPQDSIGYLECTLHKRIGQEASDVVLGNVLAAYADKTLFNERLLVEKALGKTLHHLGGSLFCTPSDQLIDSEG